MTKSWTGSSIPTTDDEVHKVFREQYDTITGEILAGIYGYYRDLGKNVLDAYLATLDRCIEVAKKVHGEKA